MKKLRWDDEQIRLERAEAHALQRQGEIDVWRGERDVVQEANDIHRPQVIVAQTLPEKSQRDRLTVVHASFRRVIANYPVHQNYLLSIKGSVFQQMIAKESPLLLSYLVVNHPFSPLNQLAVCVGPAGIRPKESNPNAIVIIPFYCPC